MIAHIAEYRTEEMSSQDMTLKGMIVTEVMPNDILCSERLSTSKSQYPGNQRFAAFFAKNYKRLASSKHAFGKKDAIKFLVGGFMRAPNGGRFLKPLKYDSSKHIILTRTQAVEWVYSSLKALQDMKSPSIPKNNTEFRDETIRKDDEGHHIDSQLIDSRVALILREQKKILLKMKKEGKIQCDVSKIA
eukprot:CAMPEP_0194216646 /NCGR_PEP_ID=MMETSP0156-20130528/19422_1 /TAXON_ID=33649 /ORGANISM="Thalassionema nitzschioides, Strain L26-B" /LENGTH=188 /DNA_ID=CAMNT_0038945467 /DNA_START=130 /DNA_END=696 /DNA_ORIENTATION=-